MIKPGTTLSHYRILERLGAGGMGVVYKAVDVKLDRSVAIKFLPVNLVANETARMRFIREAKAASALDHPHIGTIFEIDETPDAELFIVMAYYAGGSLEARLRHRPLTTFEATDIAIQVGEGLACAHQHGIVHRDIKPGNIILTGGDAIKIVDFGLAKFGDATLTEAGLTLGTPAFMAPEQTLGQPVDQRADVWALGVLLYEMLSGRLPFTGESTAEILAAIRDREPPPLEAPADLAAVVSRALAKRPRDRYASAAAMVADLRATAGAPAGSASEMETRTPFAVESDPGESTSAAVSSRTAGERRQLTVVSCEVMDYPSLAEQLDTEHVRDLLNAFRAACETVVQPLDGRIAQYHDADLTLHFGFPEAHEDDAQRAVRAASMLVGAIARLRRDLVQRIPAIEPWPLSLRFGIHTGPVVVDSSATASPVVVIGLTGAIARKIRDTGGAGDIIVSEDTSRLIGRAFRTAPLGTAHLPGISKEIGLHKVEGDLPIDAPEETQAIQLTELVGRSRELGLLVDRWHDVQEEGNGQMVLLGGEAGVGKSRLVAALRAAIRDQPYLSLECRCSPYHRNTPLWPIVDLLGRVFGFSGSMTAAEKFSRIRERLSLHGLASPEHAHLLATLLSVDPPEGESQPSVPAQRQKEQTLAAVLKLLLALASQTPTLFLVEDLHWVDPTTLELLGLMVDQGPTVPLLAIFTFRPEFASPWERRGYLTHLTLTRLPRRDAERLVQKVSGGKSLPSAVLAQIVSNSDGVPLYIEELTRSLLESGALEETAEGLAVRASRAMPVIPSTLRDSLTARLDRLGSAKEVAQMASVIGRTFPYDWLRAISPVGDQLLRRDLAKLVEAGLIYQKGLPPEATYTFKHALVKDAAYQGLLTSARQQHHARLARALTEGFQDVVATQPELVANHYAEAGLSEQALVFWSKAGQRAAQRSGNAEAAAHYRRALDLLRTLPASPEHTQQELDLLVALASVQLAIMGYAAPAVRDAYTQALELSERAGESHKLFDALQGLVNYYLVHSELTLARTQSERLVTLATKLGDADLSREATLRLGVSLYVMGSPVEARPFLEAAAADTALPDRIVYGQDPVVSARCHLAVVHWLLDLGDRSAADVAGALARGRELNHAFTLAWALLYDAILYSLRGDAELISGPVEALAALCEEQGFAYRLAQSRILRGWALARTAHDAAALDHIADGIASARATGAEAYRPYYATLLGDACLALGECSRGSQVVDEALAIVNRTDERFLEAELWRLRGEFLGVSGTLPEARECHRQAMKVARAQGARALELRAAASLARL